MPDDQKSLINALEKHLTAVAERYRWMFAAGIVFLFAGAQELATFSFGGITIARHRAYFSAALVSLYFSISVFDKFVRLRRLVILLDDSHFRDGVSALSLHPWFGNPFSQLGSTIWRTRVFLL